MSAGPESPLAAALAKLEAAMGSAASSPASPERRRVAHRLGELLRTDDADLGRFGQRHLPGREIDASDLIRGREVLLRLDRVIALLGRGVEADALLREIDTILSQRLDDLEARATAPKQLSVADLVGQGPPAALPSVGALASADAPPPELAAPLQPTPLPPLAPLSGGLPLETTPGPIVPLPTDMPLAPAAASPHALPSAAPSWVSAAPPVPSPLEEEAPKSHTIDEVPDESVAVPAAPIPFAQAGTKHTREMRAFQAPERAHVLPFAPSQAATLTPSSAAEDQALPFRKSGLNALAPLPEHLRALDLPTYATYRALVEVFPARRSEIDAHYRVPNEATAAALEIHWQRRFADDPAARAAWDEHYPRTLAHYRGQG